MIDDRYFDFLETLSESVYPVLWLRNKYPHISRQQAIEIVETWKNGKKQQSPQVCVEEPKK